MKEVHDEADDAARELRRMADTIDVRMTIRALERQQETLKEQVGVLGKIIKVLRKQANNHAEKWE